jgi:integrase
MATEIHIRKLEKSWQYDFKLPEKQRVRQGGFRTRQAALTAGQKHLAKMESGAEEITLSDAYRNYTAATKMKDRSRDLQSHHWTFIEPILGHYLIEEVDTSLLDRFKQKLPKHWHPQTINHHLGLVRAVLRFMWKRSKLAHVPYIPMESIPRTHHDWYTQEERDRLLDGMFQLYPKWYLFFYLTCRLGLRRGEVYAISHRQIRRIPPSLIVDQQLQVASKDRPTMVISRKNDEAYTLRLTTDVVAAIEWHIEQGFAGEHYLFFKSDEIPRWLDNHMKPLRAVQKAFGLRRLGHHAIGRHSVASQAATGGESIKAIQAQLGHRSEQSTHKYAHLGSTAQLRIVESLAPASPPHAQCAHPPSRVNVVSTESREGRGDAV